MTSPAASTRPAPSRIRRWQPRAIGLWIEPGTANTSRPASLARRAVIRAPERSAASTTSTPSDSPAMIRLRAGKLPRWTPVPGRYSLTTEHRSAKRGDRDALGIGYGVAVTVPGIATVGGTPARARHHRPTAARG